MSKLEKDKNQDMDQDIRLIYQIITDDLRFTKNQQWIVTNYVLLLQGAIIGFYQLVNNRINLTGNLILIILSLAIAVFGTMSICDYQQTLHKYRNRIDYILKPALSRQATAMLDKFPDKKKFCDIYLSMFIFTIWVSSFFVNWIVKVHSKQFTDFVRSTWGLVVQILIYCICGLFVSVVYSQFCLKKKN